MLKNRHALKGILATTGKNETVKMTAKSDAKE
jgi:hypothetical protein